MLETIPHPTPTRDFNNVVLKIKARQPGHRHPGELLQRVRAAGAHHAAAEGPPQGHLLGARRRGVVLQVRQGIPGGGPVHHGLQPLVRPEEPKALELKKKVEAKGEFFTYEVYMNYSCMLLLADALERAGSAERPKIIAALESSTFAGHVMPYGPTKFVNGQNEGAAPVNTQVIDNDIQVILPAQVRLGEGRVPDAGPDGARHRHASPVILVPAILNGLMTGAVYALVALGLTLIYGVLHIINFAHGALLTAAMFAVFFAYKLLGIDPYVAAVFLTPLFFALGYGLQRFVIGPAAHGEDRNILLVTLGLAVVIENALLFAFRADTRTINLPYAFDVVEIGTAFLAVPRVVAFAAVIVVALVLWLIMQWTDTGKAIRAVAKEKLGAELVGIDVAHIYAVTFGLGTACLASRPAC